MPEESENKRVTSESMGYPNSRLLGQVWVAQSLLHIFPSEEKLLEFVMQALRSVSAIRECGMCIEGTIVPIPHIRTADCSACLELGSFQHFCHLAKEADVWVVPLDTADKRYGYIQIIPQDPESFASLKPLLVNFFNSIKANLENRWQRRQLEKANAELKKYSDHLSHLVNERTAELKIKNEMLESELTHRRLMEKELKRHRDHLEELVKQRTSQLEKFQESLIHTEKLAALGKLTGSIAHEFNNPLYGVRNIIEQTLSECHLNQEFKQLLSLGLKECNRMADLVRKLREFYKPSSRGTMARLDIHRIIDEMVLLVGRQLKSRNITVEKYYAPDLPRISVVEDQITQVILNLLQNADDAIARGGKIIIRTEVSGSVVAISIQDTGEGIPEENMKLIFEPFFTTRAIKGTGLGLSVCYGIIKSHGGDIEVKSKVGEGTTVIITFPVPSD